MSFPKYNEVVPVALMNIVPDEYKNLRYRKVKDGDKATIKTIAITTYKAKDKDTGEYIERRDGTPIYNHTVYLGFDDDTYTTVRNDLILGQVANVSGWNPSIMETYNYTMPEPVPVTFKAVNTDKLKFPVIVIE